MFFFWCIWYKDKEEIELSNPTKTQPAVFIVVSDCTAWVLVLSLPLGVETAVYVLVLTHEVQLVMIVKLKISVSFRVAKLLRCFNRCFQSLLDWYR